MPLSAVASPVILRKPAAAAMLPLLLIFLCGVAVGALTMSLTSHKVLHEKVDNWNKLTVLRWNKELNLTAVQKRELETILDDFSKYYDNVLADGQTRIKGILDEDQRRKFDRMLRESKP